MSKKAYCPDCFCELEDGECLECGYEAPKKKKTLSDKRVDEFAPEMEGITWFPVKSPYKDYRDKK